MRRPVGLFVASPESGVHEVLVVDDVTVYIRRDLLAAIGPQGGVFEVSLGAWGMIPVRLARVDDPG